MAINPSRSLMYDKSEVDKIESSVLSELGISKPSNGPYFCEEVARHLWDIWNQSRTQEAQDRFVAYLYPLIDGVIFKQGSHKHGLAYEELFQTGMIRVLTSLDKYNPSLIIKTDASGSPVYSKVFSYFSLVIGFAITTVTMEYGGDKLSNISYDALSEYTLSDSSTNASMIYQEFKLYLEGLLNGVLADNHRLIYYTLLVLLQDQAYHANLCNHLNLTLKVATGLKAREVSEALKYLRLSFGKLYIENTHLFKEK